MSLANINKYPMLKSMAHDKSETDKGISEINQGIALVSVKDWHDDQSPWWD